MGFVCPYCADRSLKLQSLIVCPKCQMGMRAFPVSEVELRVVLDKGKAVYSGELPEDSARGSSLRFILPDAGSIRPFHAAIHAVYPVKGILKTSPIAILLDDDVCLQDHPQLDKPFTTFFVKGLLYSGILNAIPLIFMRPPIWIFWISTFLFAGVYSYYARKTPMTGPEAKQALLAQENVND